MKNGGTIYVYVINIRLYSIFENKYFFASDILQVVIYFQSLYLGEEEQIYLEKYKNGDMEARNILIERNLRLVAHVCKKYLSSNVGQDDLISIGTIGLIKGINSFDSKKGVRLSTYVARCIDKAILT